MEGRERRQRQRVLDGSRRRRSRTQEQDQCCAERDIMRADIAEMFADARIATGQQINEDTYYRRKNNVGDYTTITEKKTCRADL